MALQLIDLGNEVEVVEIDTVSYTHLDVYKRQPLLPLYALLLLSVPSEFTLRTLFEFDAFGERTTHNKSRCRTRNTPMKRRQPFGLNRAASFFRHEAVRFLTSSIFFVQSSRRRMSM